MSMMPNTSVSPAARRKSISPNCSPFRLCSRNRVPDISKKFGGRARPGIRAPSPIFSARSLHRAVYGPIVLVILEDGGDLAVDDAAFAVLDERAHVVVLDRRAVRRFLHLAARRLGALGRAH